MLQDDLFCKINNFFLSLSFVGIDYIIMIQTFVNTIMTENLGSMDD
jgi:hypothetical protein